MAPEETSASGRSSARPAGGTAAEGSSDPSSRGSGAREGGPAGGSEGPRPAPSESELADRFWDRVRFLALRKLGDPGAAEDVAQETLRRVIEALRQDRIRDHEALPAFVLQTARHVCSHRFRDSRRRTRNVDRFRRERPRNPGAPDPVASLVTAERRRAVKEALARLSESDRRLLRRFFYEGRETSEVARELDLEAGTVRVRKHRALQRLARELGDEPE